MNRIYRVVKNKKTGVWVVASEIARSVSAGVKATVVAGMLALPMVSEAQTVTPGGASAPTVTTQTYTRGTAPITTTPTIVKIVAPNGSGLSHNTYTQFNVGADGVVLNNVVNGGSASSVLAGTVSGNSNITTPATVILNEVISGGSASSLLGQMEVAGSKADVILANPYGISCNGCGFINVGRMTLTTGTPAGLNDISSFAVNGTGLITVGSSGLNAKGTTLLDLVARGITVAANGAVNGPSSGSNGIRVVTGPSTWTYATGAATAATASGAAPAYAIDVAALGGMYAKTISLVATEAGVGVRMAGNMAASTGAFNLTAAGQIEVSGTINAKTTASLATTNTGAATGTGAAMYLNGAVVQAEDITLTATSGTLNSVGGQLTATNDLTLNVKKLVDASTAGAAPNNLRIANGDIAITLGDDSTLAGTDWQAGSTLSLTATGKTLALDATAKISAIGNATVSVGTLTNAGTLTGSGNFTLTADTLSMTDVAKILGATSGTGTLSLVLTNGLSNPGEIHSGGALSISAESLSNTGQLTADGNIAITTTGALENKVVLGASTAGRSLGYEYVGGAITGGVLSGGVTSGTETIEQNQAITTSGLIDAGGSVTLSGGSVLNESAIKAGTSIAVTGTTILNQVQGGDTRSTVKQFDYLSTATSTSWYEDRYFTGGRPAAGPTMTAGTSLTFSGYTTAKNLGGTLTAATKTLGSGLVDDPLTTTRSYQEVITTPTAPTTPTSTQGEVTVVVKDTATTVELAPNGKVNVVNIAAPTSAGGLSVNRYTRFDVNQYGLILNNADAQNYLTAQTDLAGQILFNPHLPFAAGVILNEVYSTSPSLLYGFTEVAGQRADVIIANPYGITCGDCGFLNVDRLTLATGTPTFTAGALSGISVNSGIIDIHGNGLNALGAQKTDLLARGISLDGPVNAHDLVMAAGINTWTYATRQVSAGGTATGTVPAYSIYSSVPGGMYADTIRLVSTEAGLGVRLMGEAAAAAGDFVLNSNGKIMLAGKTSASNDVRVTSTSTASGNDFSAAAIQLNDAAVSAGNDVLLTDSAGKIAIRGGQLFAGRDVQITAASLTDENTTHPQVSNNQRYAARDMSFILSGSGNLTGTNWLAGDDLLINAAAGSNAGSFVINSTALMSAVTGATIKLASLDNYGTLKTSTTSGTGTESTLSVTNLTNRSSGKIDSVGDVTYTVSGTLRNESTIQGRANMTMNVGTLTLVDSADQILGAQGGTGLLSITTATAFTNPGLVHSGQDLSITAPGITNQKTGGMVAARDMSLTASGATSIANYGAWYAGRNLTATASGGTISNNRTFHLVQGRLLGVDSNGTSIYEKNQVTDSRGTIDAVGNLTFSANQIINSALMNVGGNASFTGTTILNQVQGGDTRTKTGQLDYATTENTVSSYSFPDAYEDTTKVATWHIEEYFSGGRPDANAKPQINAGGTLSWLNFVTAKNLGGLLQAPTINITAPNTSTFTNDALATVSEQWSWTTVRSIHYIALGPLTYSDDTTGAAPTAPVSTSTSFTYGATAKAATLTITGPTVVNKGAVNDNVAGTTTVGSAPNATGLTITLPSNPNGYFVTNRDPSALYLVEANPKFNVGVSTLGSDYLATQLGLDPGTVQKRLGDASYEAYLVQQQLIEQTGAGLLDGFADMAELMKGMFENAAEQANTLGLHYGKEPTAAQLSNLKEPIIWMVETIIDGQKVLAPVVYLPEHIKNEIDNKSAVLTADKVTMDVAALTNAGGTIEGKDELDITSKGDVTNLSGTIKGGNVSVTSTEGSIINKTVSQGGGNELDFKTTIGKTATIASTGKLSLDAKKDIQNIGAQMSADGDASLKAGENIVFDTIEDKTTKSSMRAISDGLASGVETSTTTTVNQVKSGLTVGGNLNAKAGKDITLAGTDVNVKGSGNLDAGGNLNIVARENTVETDTKSRMAGLGVGGGVYGTTETTTNDFSSRNVGSTLNIGGDATLSAGKTLTVQGSKINVGGDTEITATDIKVLAGKDVDKSTSTTKTTSFLSVETVSNPSSGDDTESTGVTLSKAEVTESSKLSQRSVGSELNLGGNVKINAKNKVTLQGSDLNAGGDLDLQAKDVELLAAENIERTSTSTTTTRVGLYASSENNADAGGSSGSGANASADASAKSGGPKHSASASAEAGADANAEGEASASSNNTLDFARVDQKSKETLNLTHTGSKITSGGKTKITAENKLRLVGSSIEAEGDVDLKAKDMSFEAAQDITYSKETSGTTRAGLYADAGAEAKGSAGASASAGANAGAGVSGAANSANVGANAEANAEAGGEANAKAGVGLQVKSTTTTTEKGTSTALTSAIKSKSGSVSRTAEGTILDVGTTIEAGKDFNQSAKNIISLAATNSQFETTTTEENTARAGLYVEAGGEGKAGAGGGASAGAYAGTGKPSANAKAEGEAGVSGEGSAKAGVEATFDRNVTKDTYEATQAVTSTIKVGGNINSKSTEKTVLQGTNMEAGGELNLSASELEILAARDTEKTTSSSESLSTRLAVNIGVTGEAEAGGKASAEDGATAKAEAKGGVQVGAEAQMNYEKNKSEQQSSKAVVANLSGGKININTTGKTTMEGTNLNAGDGGVNIDAKSLDFKAAQDTFSSSESSTKVGMDAKLGVTLAGNADSGVELQANVGTSSAQSSGTNAVVGSINSGGGLTIRTQDDTRLEGTQINVAGDTNVSAGGNVIFDAAKNTFQASSESVDVGAGMNANSGGDFGFNANVDVNKASESSTQAVTGSLNTGGSLNITAGKSATFVGTQIEAGGDAQVVAGENVEFKEARNTSTSESTSVSAGAAFGSQGDENQLKGTESTTKTGSLNASVGYESAKSSEAVAGSIKAGNNLNIVAGKDATFVGTELGAGNGAAVSAGGNVNFKAAESTSESTSVGVSVGVSAEDKTTTKAGGGDSAPAAGGDAPAGGGDAGAAQPSMNKATNEGSLSLDVGVSSSKTQQGSTISAGAGGIQINSGKDTNLQGTQMATTGSAAITAGGNVNKTAAVSTSTEVGIGLDAGFKTEKETGDLGGGDAKPPAAGGAAAPAAEESAPGDAPPTQLRDLSVDSTSTSQATSIKAAGGTSVQSGRAPSQPIPGVSMTLRASTQSDGSVKALVPMPGSLPAGKQVSLTQPDGSALPSWVQFDSATGAISGTPPADFAGGLNIVVGVPQADGTVRKVGVQF